MFLYKFFGKDILAPCGDLQYFPHNALGETLSESEEVYELIKNNYEYQEHCLKAKCRSNDALVHQQVYNFYVINKYQRKINNSYGAYIDLASAKESHFHYKLFCINTGGDRRYSDLDFLKAKIKMNLLFPRRSKYELPELKDGTYVIESALDSNKVLDIESSSNSDKARLQIYDKNNTDAQKFIIKYHGEGYYTIQAKCSNKMLDVANSENTYGTKIWQYCSNNTDAQKWYVIPGKDGYYSIVAKCNGMCIDVRGGSKDNGTPIHCWEINETSAQKFKFVKQ